MKTFRRSLCCAAWLGFAFPLASSGWAREPVVVQGAREAIVVSPHIALLADPSNAYDIEAVSGEELGESFAALEQERLNLGVIDGTYWLRFDVRNAADFPVEQYLEVERTTFDAVDLYRVGDEGGVAHQA